MSIHLDSSKRHDFQFLLEIIDGNPNGDPDAGNLPRTDPETLQGLMSDVCIKRKVRNWVDLFKGQEERYKIYVQDKGIALNTLHGRAYTALEQTGEIPANSDRKNPSPEAEEKLRSWMAANFYDVRTFGGVMSTGVNCGQARGPIQIMFARSVSPILPLDLAITRVAVTREGEQKRTEIGRKAIVPYALYLGRGYYTPHFAAKSGFDDEDLAVFWEAFIGAWDVDRSASRGSLSLRKLHVYSHDNPRGNAPAHKLLERFSVEMVADVQAPRRFSDYTITLDDHDLPEGVTLTRLVD